KLLDCCECDAPDVYATAHRDKLRWRTLIQIVTLMRMIPPHPLSRRTSRIRGLMPPARLLPTAACLPADFASPHHLRLFCLRHVSGDPLELLGELLDIFLC